MPFSASHIEGRHPILSRILLLRILALAIALLALLFFQFYLQRQLSYGLLYGVLVAATIYSVATSLRLRNPHPVSNLELASHLLVDAAVLILLVAFSGRATNPFIYYLLVLVAIGAAIFERWLSWLLAFLAILAYTLLLYFDLEAHMHHLFSDFQLHLVGMWVNFVGSTLLITFFVSTLATALRERQAKLAHEREKSLQNEQLVAMGTLAASTVHALGTPLSTMAIILSDMDHQQTDEQTIGLLKAQVERCKNTMARLSALADKQETGGQVSVQELFHELEHHYHLLNPTLVPEFELSSSVAEGLLPKTPLLNHALINIIDNAIRAARQQVKVSTSGSGSTLQIHVQDDGAGLSPEQAKNFGKPGNNSSAGGMGIGVFLANTSIEQLGGKILLFTAENHPSGNTVVEITLPLKPPEIR